MDTFQDIWTFATEQVLPHWPGISFALFIAVIAQTLKVRVFTVELARTNRVVYWLRRVFPIALLLLGILPGLTWPGEVYPGIDTMSEKVWYFIGCSGVSILGFNVFKQWVKRKYDVDIGISTLPPSSE